ncbi:MAG: response regulator [Bacteroidales bacterium]|nr:response regulator [Bacteroidales bacterium]
MLTLKESDSTQSKKQLKILLVGRAAQDHTLYCLLLKGKATIQSTHDVDEAIEQVRESGIVNLLIMEILVPGYEGLHKVSYLRDFLPDIPLLIQVDNQLYNSEEDFILTYGDAVVEKPLSQKKIFKAMYDIGLM